GLPQERCQHLAVRHADGRNSWYRSLAASGQGAAGTGCEKGPRRLRPGRPTQLGRGQIARCPGRGLEEEGLRRKPRALERRRGPWQRITRESMMPWRMERRSASLTATRRWPRSRKSWPRPARLTRAGGAVVAVVAGATRGLPRPAG